jgi:hypothetical protein
VRPRTYTEKARYLSDKRYFEPLHSLALDQITRAPSRPTDSLGEVADGTPPECIGIGGGSHKPLAPSRGAFGTVYSRTMSFDPIVSSPSL